MKISRAITDSASAAVDAEPSPIAVNRPTTTRRVVRYALKGLRVAWGVLGVCLLFWLGAEIVADRLFLGLLATKGDVWRAGFADQSEVWLDDFAGEMAQTVTRFELDGGRWEPYAGWRNEPFAGRSVKVDADGLRATWRPPSVGGQKLPRVFAFGGSVMWGVGNRDDWTLPSQLARRAADAGRPIEVVNFAQIGYVSGQEVLTLLAELERGNVPDVVVFLDGYNDCSASFLNGEAGLTIREAQRRAEFNSSRRPLWDSIAEGFATSATVRLLQAIGGKQGPAPRPGQAYWQSPAQMNDATARHYARQIRVVEALAAQFGFRALFCWQPVVFGKRALSAEEMQQTAGREGQAQLIMGIYERARAACQSGAAPTLGYDWGTNAIVATDIFNAPEWDGRTAFFDRCHLTEAATGTLAAMLLPRVLERLPEPQAPGH